MLKAGEESMQQGMHACMMQVSRVQLCRAAVCCKVLASQIATAADKGKQLLLINILYSCQSFPMRGVARKSQCLPTWAVPNNPADVDGTLQHT